MNFEDYKVNMPYPTRSPKPKLPKEASAAEVRAFADALEAWENGQSEYDEQMRKYREAEMEVHARFKKDVLEKNGLKDHPKADLVYSKAWEHGHASGFHDVAYWVGELAELVL